MEKYELLGQVGEGSFGQVYRAKKRADGEIVAFKVIRKRGRTAKELKSLRQECDIQKHLNHPNIILMLDSFETENEIVVVTEYADKELYEILGKAGRLSEERAQVITCDLVSALYYLHSNRVLHRDLKPQNVLLETNGIAKLCDFGFARSMSTGTHVLTSIKGTPLYMAPELIDERPYDHNADLWSLGCIVYELVVGAPPFQTTSILHLIKLIRFEAVKWPDHISSVCKSFLQGLLQKDPSRRLSWPEILEHPFVKDRILKVSSPVPASLTAPLSESQAEAKQQQFQSLTTQSIKKSNEFIERTVQRIQEEKNFIEQSSRLYYHKTLKHCHYDINQPYHSHLRRGVHSEIDSSASVDVLLGNLSLRASLQSELLDCRDVCTNELQDLENSSFAKLCPNQRFECVTDIAHSPILYVPEDSRNYDIPGISKKIHKYGNSKMMQPNNNHNNDALLANVNFEQIRLPDWHPKSVDQPIENEEWVAFIQRSMEEVMRGEIDSFMQQNCVSIFVSPLRNSTASSQVIENVAYLLALPFVVETTSRNLEKIKQVYLDVRVVPNLFYATKLLMLQEAYAEIPREMKVLSTLTLSVEQLQALEFIILLLCRLIHIKGEFLTQFCDAVYIVSGIPLLKRLLSLEKKKPRIVACLVAILNNVLQSQPENAELVEKVVLDVEKTGRSGVERLERLLLQTQKVIRIRTCILIGLLCRFCCRALQHVWKESLCNILEESTTENDIAMRKAAGSALKELGQLPH